MARKQQLSLLVTSDVHGYVYPTNYSDSVEKNLGLAKVATMIKELRVERDTVLINNGDLIQGSPLTFYHAKYESNRANPMIKVSNYLHYDVSIFGNHEFNYGLDYLQAAIDETNHPWLAANIVDEETQQPAYGTPYVMKDVNGISIAILGMTTHYIPNWEDPKNIQGLRFTDAYETTKAWVKHIHAIEKPDVLVVSYHGGFERDIATGEPTEELTGENQGYQMCMDIEGIDVLITGHQHRSIADTINGVSVIQPSNNAQLLGEIQLELEEVDGKWAIVSKKPYLHAVGDNVVADEEMLQLIEGNEQGTQAWLDQPIGMISGDMGITDPFQVRLADHPFIEFVNKVQMEIAKVHISNTSLFNNASPGFPEQVTMRDIVSNYIYPNTLKVIRISGQDIKEALEQSATYFLLNDKGELAVNPAFVEPKPQHYNYDMWEGIDYELKISNPVGERVTKLEYQGKPIEYDCEYEVVMNNYRAGGGGNYRMYQGKPVVNDITTDMTELIANFILKRKTIEATCNNNWRVIK